MRSDRWVRPNPISVLLIGALIAGCTTSSPAPASNALFEQDEILPAVEAKRATVLSGFFLGRETAEIAVVHVGSNYRSRVDIFSLKDNAWVPALTATLDHGVKFVDVASIDGRDRIITYRNGHVNWFDTDTATLQPLIDVEMRFRAEGQQVIPSVDISHDLNGDGRDDLLMPQVDGFWVSVQKADGAFAEAVKLGPPEPLRDETVGNIHAGADSYDASTTFGQVGVTDATLNIYLGRVHQMDYNLDGKSDLVFWNEDHFDAYLQQEDGSFTVNAVTFSTDVPFDSDGTYSYAEEFKDQGAAGAIFGFKEKTRRTVLHSLRDLSGDGVVDLVTLTLSGRSFVKQKSVYEIHLGVAMTDGIVFEPEASTSINPRGKGGAMQPWGYASQLFQDFDGDGQTDIMFREVDVGLTGMGRALIGNSVALNLEFHRGEDGVYPSRPTARRKIKRFAPFAGVGNVYFPTILVGDVNGDGRADLLAGHSPEILHVFPGVQGPGLFARRPVAVAVDLPADERDVVLADLNGDSKLDIVVQFRPTERLPDAPHRIVTLIAR